MQTSQLKIQTSNQNTLQAQTTKKTQVQSLMLNQVRQITIKALSRIVGTDEKPASTQEGEQEEHQKGQDVINADFVIRN